MGQRTWSSSTTAVTQVSGGKGLTRIPHVGYPYSDLHLSSYESHYYEIFMVSRGVHVVVALLLWCR